MMSSYQAPLRDMHFALELAGLDEIAKLPGFEEAAEMAEPILAEAANFASNVLDPLNQIGDREGAVWVDGEVHMPKGFKEAYHQFGEAGWIGLPMPAEYGGQGLPQLLSTATLEMWNASNMGFALGPLLNQGAIEAILLYATDELRQAYVPNLVSGKWTGTMDLTEPQAGSDLAAVSTRAVPEGDHYRITGNKIFITYGEHDMAENIVHLVLARTPTAPPGVKGISLFIVPKFLVNADGSLGARNDVNCASIEHKIGIHASPTAVLNYGEKDGAIGYVVGEENKGLSYMFVMMNLARFSVGVQGLAVSDRAYQLALEYSKERIQSAQIGSKDYKPVAIINHPDVRRMLLTIKATVEAQRALAFVTAAAIDNAGANPDEAIRKESQAFVELMTPIVKGWSTETSTELTSLAMQVQGGMGYVEETGAAQYFRDARITPIYEGTTAIQANDLLGRKLLKDQGKTASVVIGRIQKLAEELAKSETADLKAIGEQLGKGVAALGDASMWLGMNAMANLPGAFAGSVPYLKLWGTVAGGWQLARAAQVAQERLAAGDRETDFYQAKVTTARFYADHILPLALTYRHEIKNGSSSILAITEAQFGADRKTLSAV
jgi:alkylation response protein AidB-like acyl-CoA dehydrogenase